MNQTLPGSVTLVGAGPGDPELLTIQAVKAIRQATVLLVDDLVDEGVLRWARRSARIVHVGKRGGGFCAPRPSPATAVPRGEPQTLGRPGGEFCAPRPSPATAVPRGEPRTLGRPGGSPSTPQSFIHKLMIAEARRGERVVRLKGGDPFVFGRGGEECDALRAAGIEPRVVSGLTAGIAGPAAIGLPVTDRRHAQGVALVTGHARDGGEAPDWQALARCGLTLVIYMGIARCGEIQRALLDAGMAADTPAAVVSHACTPRQRHALCRLDALADTVREAMLPSPALLVVGEAVHGALPAGLLAPAPAAARAA